MIVNLIYNDEVIKMSFARDVPQIYSDVVCDGVRYKVERITYDYDTYDINVELLRCRADETLADCQ